MELYKFGDEFILCSRRGRRNDLELHERSPGKATQVILADECVLKIIFVLATLFSLLAADDLLRSGNL